MTRYLVTDTDLRDAIQEAMKTQDRNPGGLDYVITSSINVVKDVLKRLDRYKVAETEQTETPERDSRSEIDTSERPFIQLRSNELVEMICSAYQKGTEYQED